MGYLPIELCTGAVCFGDPEVSAHREVDDRRGEVHSVDTQIDNGANLSR
ncbi:Uncharacterised protein [Mycobacteroides abscessus subsp. bolletii]|jgi:hypothetical protein|nr:Uncharacterised protein [Mycobacteroides abscessus subsp. bolletii]